MYATLLAFLRACLQTLTSQTSGAGSAAAAAAAGPPEEGAPAALTDEQRDAALELREKLRIVQTVLEQVWPGLSAGWCKAGEAGGEQGRLQSMNLKPLTVSLDSSHTPRLPMTAHAE
jgi:hypothetical protein